VIVRCVTEGKPAAAGLLVLAGLLVAGASCAVRHEEPVVGKPAPVPAPTPTPAPTPGPTPTPAPGPAPAGGLILSEASAWRSHVSWAPALYGGAGGVKPAKLWRGLTQKSELPPEGWAGPEFDDSSWSLWRETHVPATLKAKDGTETGVRLYDEWQYGIQLSQYVRLRCLRGRFRVGEGAVAGDLSLTVAYRGGVVA
jgi:hypothetical protein